MCKILSPSPEQKVIATIPQIEGLYSVFQVSKQHAHLAKQTRTIHDLHKVLGHVLYAAVQYAIRKGLVTGVQLDSTSSAEFCEACVKAKSTHKPFPKETSRHTIKYGGVVHTDLWGPAQMVSVAGSSYYMSFTNDYLHKSQMVFLKHKSEALEAFKQYEKRLTTQHDRLHIKMLHSDRGGEYLSTNFDTYLKDHGITRELTVHDSPQQNGVVERLNRTLVEHARAMLIAHSLPKFLWAEVINYVVWLKNHLPSRSIPGHTPYALIHNEHPDLSGAYEFGCSILVHVEHAGKLEPKANEAMFIGVDTESKGYQVYWSEKRRVSIERNVTFGRKVSLLQMVSRLRGSITFHHLYRALASRNHCK